MQETKIINDIISRILRDYTRSSIIIFVMDEDIVRFSMKYTKVYINIIIIILLWLRFPGHKSYFLYLDCGLICLINIFYTYCAKKSVIINICRLIVINIGIINLLYVLYIILSIFILFFGLLETNLISDQSFLNSSYPNNDFTNNSDFFHENNSSTGGGGNDNPTEEGNNNRTKKDTDHLYEYLVQFESKKLKDAKLNLRTRRVTENASVKEKYLLELSRIFSNVRKENPQIFSYSNYEQPGNTILTNDFLNKILSIKKDYYGWPDRRR